MSTNRAYESRVFAAPIDRVWAQIRPATLSFWTTAVESSHNTQAASVGGMTTLNFKDGTKQVYQIREISDLKYKLTYELIESEPSIASLGASHTIRLRPITHDNTTLVEWESFFAYDGSSSAAVQDSRYKKIEAFADLAKAL